MRRTSLVTAVLLGALALAAPPAEGHWHGGPYWGYGGPYWGWGWGIGAGPFWWGGGWAVPPPGYGPGAISLPRADVATVEIGVSPEHARVVLDGQLIGVADDFDGSPGYLYLKPGHYTLEFTLKGYKTERIELDAERGRYVPIGLKLERIKGEKAAPWYDRPEGLPERRVFGPKGAAPAPAGKAGPDPALRPELHDHAVEAAPPHTSAGGGALELRISPPNAAIYIDGKFVGTGEEMNLLERGLAVPPGTHRIEVVAPGRPGKTIEVDVTEGAHQQVFVELDGGTGQT